MKKVIKRITCLIMCLVLVCLFVCLPSLSTEGAGGLSAITSQAIKDMQQQIKNSEALQKKLESSITNAQAVKRELESLKKDVTAYITKLDKEIDAVHANIEEYNRLIIEKENEIVLITEELQRAIETEETQYEAMKTRIKFIYEQSNYIFIEMILNAKSFSDFLTKADYIQMLSDYDAKKLEEYKNTREWTEICKLGLETEKATLDATKAALEAEEASLNELMATKESELAKYKKEIAAKEDQIDSYQNQLEEQTDVIDELEAKILEEQKRIAAENGVVLTYDGGAFTWPCPSYTRITSDYGTRTAPLKGASTNHRGVDMGAPYGSAILAAYDGVVVAASYDWSMGNYVMINHGSGLFTIYMHCSKLLVKPDDIVARGEKIAQVGSTGNSTGNHLHFGVKLNGSYVSPWNYLKKK